MSRELPIAPPRLGLGCMALTGLYGPIDKQDAIGVIHCALNHGIDHFDTAELYGPYSNETLLAEALDGRTHAATVATKIGYAIQDGTIVGVDNSPASLRGSVEGCLKRLRRDRIDLLYLHRVDARIPIEDTMGVLAELVSRGDVAAIGLSAVDGATILRAHAVHPIAAVQNEYSLIARRAETDALPRARALNIAFVAFSPLGRGLLAARSVSASARNDRDYRKGRKEFGADRITAIDEALAPVHAIAAQRGCKPAQVGLAWVLAQSVSAIPGARSQQHVIDCRCAADIALDAKELAQLSHIDVGSSS